MITQLLPCPTARGSMLSGMSRRLKASNAIAAENVSSAVGVRFCWTIPMPAKPMPANHRR
jgi:hypothetical protein